MNATSTRQASPAMTRRLLWQLLLCAWAVSFAHTAVAQTATPKQEPATKSRQQIYALRLKPGQDLRTELERFTKTMHLQAAYIITGVGSLNFATLRLANESNNTRFEGKFEIVSLVGTLTPDGPHLHLAIADKTGKTLGGHLVVGCEIYTTAEIIIGEAQDLLFTREPDEASGYQELKIKRRGKIGRRQ